MVHGRNLVLQQLTRQAEGVYRCQVESDIETVTSNAAFVKVMCEYYMRCIFPYIYDMMIGCIMPLHLGSGSNGSEINSYVKSMSKNIIVKSFQTAVEYI